MSPDAPVTCSFGIVAPTKRPLDVLAAWHAAFATDRSAVLAFVGDAGQALTAELRRLAAQYGMSNRLILTGRVDTETYRHWLDAADIAVQLRTDSRGETSAAIADCMAVGLPVVANAHGAAAELPPDTLALLPDAASTAALGAAIAALWADRPRRLAIAQAATAYVQTDLSPMAAARAYRDAIEHFYASGNAARSRLAMPALPDTDIAEAARALASNFRPPAPARLLLDASNMAQQDLGTGIQRVIREISQRVLASPDPSCLADMVRLDGTTLRHARKFAARLLDVSSHGLPDLPVLAGAGDTIVLMDNYGNITPDDIAALQRQRRQGARIVVVIYDLLPLQRPDWFPPDAIPLLQRWLRESLGLADAALCISRIVAEELLTWLGQDDALPARALPLDIGWFHLGADFRAAVAATGEDEAGEAALRSARQRPTLLMVGTIEPRKGHAEAVAAFDHVWASGKISA